VKTFDISFYFNLQGLAAQTFAANSSGYSKKGFVPWNRHYSYNTFSEYKVKLLYKAIVTQLNQELLSRIFKLLSMC